MKICLQICSLIFSLFWMKPCGAFPELIRHGYKSCTTCHSSVVGGENLTPYGKSLAQELLANHEFWPQVETEESNEELSPSFDGGGHLRFMQIHRDSSQRRDGRFFLMQLEGHLNWSKGLWSVYSSVGRVEPSEKADNPADFVSLSRVWGQYVTSLDEPSRFLFRLGKFIPGYGLNIAEHTSVNRSALHLTPGSERLNFEVALENENALVLLDLITGRYQKQKLIDEKGFLFQYSWLGIDGIRLGLNTIQTKVRFNNESSEESSVGGFAILGWSKQFSQLLQMDVIEHTPGGKSFSIYSKLSYEAYKGVNFFTTQEYFNDDIRIVNPHSEVFSIGAQYFPIASVDLLVNLRQEKNTALSKEADTVLWLLGHLYL